MRVKVPDVDAVNVSLLDKGEEIELLKRLAQYPEEIKLTAETVEPSRLTRYVLDVAQHFTAFITLAG